MLSEEILLIKYKKQNQEYYARKLGNVHYHYKFLGLTNKQNQLTHICTAPRMLLLSPLKCDEKLKQKTQYTVKAFDKKFKEEEKVFFHYFLPSFQIREPVNLDKKVRGLRFATDEERKIVSDEIVKFWCDYNPITLKERLYHSERYGELWSKCMENEVMDSFFNYME